MIFWTAKKICPKGGKLNFCHMQIPGACQGDTGAEHARDANSSRWAQGLVGELIDFFPPKSGMTIPNIRSFDPGTHAQATCLGMVGWLVGLLGPPLHEKGRVEQH